MIKTYTVSVSGIIWDIDEDYDETCGDWGLPSNGIFEVESSVDPYEKWNEEGTISGYELFCEEVVDAFTLFPASRLFRSRWLRLRAFCCPSRSIGS